MTYLKNTKKTLRAPQGAVITACREVIKDLVEIEVPKEKLKYSPQTRILSFTVGGPLKSEVMLHKKDILTHLKGRLGPQNAPKDII